MKRVAVLLLGLFLLVPSMHTDEKSGGVKKIGNPAPAGAPVKEIEVSAKKYEFTPAEIEVPVNTLVRLHLKATDKEHGFELKSVKDSCVKFKPGAPSTGRDRSRPPAPSCPCGPACDRNRNCSRLSPP